MLRRMLLVSAFGVAALVLGVRAARAEAGPSPAQARAAEVRALAQSMPASSDVVVTPRLASEMGVSCGSPCAASCGSPCGCCAQNPCCVRGEMEILAWIAGAEGDAVFRGNPAEIDTSPWDILGNLDKLLENLDFMFTGSVGARWGRWHATLGVFYWDLGGSVPIRPQSAAVLDIDASQVIAQATLGYVFGPYCCGPCSGVWTPEVYAGLRFNQISATLDLGGAGTRDSDHDWLDPIVGARLGVDLRNRWSLHFQGDVGGFGVGSELSWLLRADVRYALSCHASITLGFGAISNDFSEGSGGDRFEWDVVQYGPYLGLAFSF